MITVYTNHKAKGAPKECTSSMITIRLRTGYLSSKIKCSRAHLSIPTPSLIFIFFPVHTNLGHIAPERVFLLFLHLLSPLQ